MKMILAVLILTAVLVPGVGQAQLAPNSWFVVPMVNYNVATISDFGSSINGLGAGLQFDRVLGGSGSISLGITANYVKVDGTISEQVQAPISTEPLNFAAETKGGQFAVYGRYMFGGPGIIGYIGAGPGMFIGETTVNVVDEPDTTQSGTKFAGMGMAGGMFKMGDKVYLNASVTVSYVPEAELFAETTWGGNLGIVIPLGNP